ncbi:MAG TPA: alpha/beta fold hydrolase [Solirubrobacteraceae bacterium]|jgi:haloalkane dehalogenase|nr:alpha/beta fold hydrolase [Solirubrobacteraceae bacterium]
MLAARVAEPVGAAMGEALLLHGVPESSYMWRELLPTVADAGFRAVAPDLPGFGASPVDPPTTWERQVEAVERFRREARLDNVALIVHDWGGLIGLRWPATTPTPCARS